MTKPIFKIRKAPKTYKLDPEKLKGASQSILPYLFGSNLHYTEDYEYFDKIRPYLDIPEPRKSIEEIQQELEDNFDVLMARTIGKFEYSKEIAEKRYNQKFDKIIENFEYAKEHGTFPHKLSFTVGNGLTVNGSYITSNFVIKPDTIGVGYWEIKPNVQMWLKQKPNWLVRKCAKIFFDFTWKDG